MLLRRVRALLNTRENAALLRLYITNTRVQPSLQSPIRSSIRQTTSARKLDVFVHTISAWSTNSHLPSHDDTESSHKINSENDYAQSILVNSKKDPKTIASPLKMVEPITDAEVELLLNCDWSALSGTEILDALKKISCHTKLNSRGLCQETHGRILLSLKEKLEELNDEELEQVFQCFILWPSVLQSSFSAYEKLWRKLDEECTTRLVKYIWSIDKILLFADYQVKIEKNTDYLHRAMYVLCRKPKRLTLANYLHTMTLISKTRRRPKEMYEMEYRLYSILDEFTVNEISVICMAFFKTETRFRDKKLVTRIQRKVLDSWDEMYDFSLSAIMKATRYNALLTDLPLLYKIFDKVKMNINELALSCLIHVVHAAAYVLYWDKELMQLVIERFEKDIVEARLKDLERICWVLSVFNYDSKTPLYLQIIECLRDVKRREEMETFPTSMLMTLQHLSDVGVFPIDLIRECFQKDYVHRLCKGHPRAIESVRFLLFTLDQNLKLDAPEYEGPFMNDDVRNLTVKRHLAWIAKTESAKKDSPASQFAMDVVHVCKLVLGSDTAVCVDHVLPHYGRPDLIICLDELNNPISPESTLSKMPFGSIKYQKASNFRWFAIVLATQNQVLQGQNHFAGMFNRKLRQLKTIGYTPVAVPIHEWTALGNTERKKDYLRNLLPELNTKYITKIFC